MATKKNANSIMYLILILFTFVLYINTIFNDYALDDKIVITKNEFVKQGVKGIKNILLHDTFMGFYTETSGRTIEEIEQESKDLQGGRYRPLSLVTFALETSIFGANKPGISHFINILLYALTVCLLFLILNKLFPAFGSKSAYPFFNLSFFAALLFAAHPIHTEVVANIKGRDEIMVLLGGLTALWLTIKFAESNKYKWLLLSGICLFLALLSKENAIAFTVLIPLAIYYAGNNNLKTLLTSFLPLLAATLLFIYLRGIITGNVSDSENITSEWMNDPFLYATAKEKYATIFFTLWMYLKLLFFPNTLTYDYYPGHIKLITPENPAAFLPFMFYIFLFVYAVYGLLKKKDVVSFSIWLYLIPLAIVSNVFVPVGTFMNERFVYISSVGFCLFLGWIVYRIIPSFFKKTNTGHLIAGGVMLIVLALYTWKTIDRNVDWKNDYLLFTTDIRTSPESAKGNCAVGGVILEKAQQPDIQKNKPEHNLLCSQAVFHLEKAVKIYPKYKEAFLLLGNARHELNFDVAGAFSAYTHILRLEPRHSLARNNIKLVAEKSISLLDKKMVSSSPEDILKACDEILAIAPDLGEIYYLKGVLYGKYGNNLPASMENMEKANSIDFPKNAGFYNDLGIVYGMAGQYEKALQHLLHAIELNPSDPSQYINAGITYRAMGDIENAEKYMQAGQNRKNNK